MKEKGRLGNERERNGTKRREKGKRGRNPKAIYAQG
jgi:hypothetical protein